MREFPVSRFVLVAFVMLIYGCQQPHYSNETTKNESTETFEDFENPVVDSAIANACSSKVMITELPIGFKFGNTKKDVNNNIERLKKYGLKKMEIVAGNTDMPIWDYIYITQNNKKYRACIYYDFDENNLYSLTFELQDEQKKYPIDLTEEVRNSLDKDLTAQLGSGYKRYHYNIKNDFFSGSRTYWIKNNMIVIMEYDHQYSTKKIKITYNDAPVYVKKDNEMNERIAESARIQYEKIKQRKKETSIPDDNESEYKVYNSEWDGSVYPVKLYLKKNLKDPDSYEAIEWSKVQKTNEGYMVRHKYRAKNSFGGYVIENKVFYLNKKGHVYRVN